MFSVSTHNIMSNTDLTCITTSKFKTGFISVNFLTPLSEKTVCKNALLPRVLCRGTSEHPDMTSIASALDELYGARIEPIVRKKGETLCVGMYASFLDDDFVSRKENILENTISLLGEMLLSPATRGGLLLDKYVEGEKINLIDEIRSAKNDKIRYAIQRMLETMCKKEPYGVSSLGTEAAAASITNRSLTKHYKELITNSKLEIIYCGSAPVDRVKNALVNTFATLPRRSTVVETGTKPVAVDENAKVKEVYDPMDVAQGKLTLGYRLSKSSRYFTPAALMVFNALFGGSVTSKLFMNVREKLSLCYYASSTFDKHKNILIVYSGVEFSNFEKALNEIKTQLDDIRSGKISEYELDSARKFVSTSLRTRTDSASGLEDFYLDSLLTGYSLSPNDTALTTADVTVEDVMAIAQAAVLDTVHYITSVGGDSNEA